MKVSEFSKEIEADIDWRAGQFAELKSIPVKYNLSDKHRNLFMRYTVPAIYAIWEGYVVNISRTYITYVNKCKLTLSDVNIYLLTHAVNVNLKLNEGKVHLDSQKRAVEKLYDFFTTDIILPTKVSTQSNVNFKVINQILDYLNLAHISEVHKSPLDKLLRFRNDIAHGDNSLPVTEVEINEFVDLTEKLMEEVLIIFTEGMTNETYRKVRILTK